MIIFLKKQEESKQFLLVKFFLFYKLIYVIFHYNIIS